MLSKRFRQEGRENAVSFSNRAFIGLCNTLQAETQCFCIVVNRQIQVYFLVTRFCP